MKRPILALIALLLAGLAPAVAQVTPFPQTVPSNSVVGRLGSGASGPTQAIPFSRLAPPLFGTICTAGTNAKPVVSTGAACIPSTLTVPGGGTGGTTFTQDRPLLGNGANAFNTGTKSGNTNTFVTTTGTLPNGDCVKIDANGNFVDSGATCIAGTSAAFVQDFNAGTDFTAGSTTSLVLSSAPAAATVLQISFDGIVQSHSTWALVGSTVTFNAAIPANVQVVEAQWMTASTMGGIGSIGSLTGGAVTCGNALDCGTGVASPPTLSVITPPGGRLTLQSGVAYPTDVSGLTAKTTIYYTCTGRNMPVVPIPASATQLISLPIPGCEISTGLSGSFVNLANGYDLFIVKVGTTATLCYGNQNWTTGSQTGNSIAHGTFHIHNTLGVWTNQDTITNCYSGAAGTTDLGPIAADRALYVGSFLASNSGQVSHAPQPTRAAGGTNTWCGLYNAYNKAPISCRDKDSTATGYNTTWTSGASIPCNSAAAGALGPGTNNRINWIDGLGQDWWEASLKFSVAPISSVINYATTVEIGLDSAAVTQEVAEEQVGSGSAAALNDGREIRVDLMKAPTIGKHFVQCLENGANTFYFTNDFMHFWLRVWM